VAMLGNHVRELIHSLNKLCVQLTTRKYIKESHILKWKLVKLTHIHDVLPLKQQIFLDEDSFHLWEEETSICGMKNCFHMVIFASEFLMLNKTTLIYISATFIATGCGTFISYPHVLFKI